MPRPLFAICLFFVLASSGCSYISTSEVSDINMSDFDYSGQVTAIDEPVDFNYAPGNATLKYETVTVTPSGKGEMSMRNDYQVVPQDGYLVWHVAMPQIRINDNEKESDVPLAKAVIVTNPKGMNKQIEMSFPALEEKGVYLREGSTRYQQMLAMAKNPFPEIVPRPVASGEVLFESSVEEIMPPGHEAVGGKRIIGPVVAGWSEFDKRKVLVLKINYKDILTRHVGSRELFTTDMYGYKLLDAQTLIPVSGAVYSESVNTRTGQRIQISNKLSQARSFLGVWY